MGQREDQQREVASLTKIMTTIVALEWIEKYQLDKGKIRCDFRFDDSSE